MRKKWCFTIHHFEFKQIFTIEFHMVFVLCSIFIYGCCFCCWCERFLHHLLPLYTVAVIIKKCGFACIWIICILNTHNFIVRKFMRQSIWYTFAHIVRFKSFQNEKKTYCTRASVDLVRQKATLGKNSILIHFITLKISIFDQLIRFSNKIPSIWNSNKNKNVIGRTF